MSKHTITFDQLASWSPCDLDKHKLLFASSATLSVSQALDAGATVSNILWVAGKLELTMDCVIFAIRCAEKVVHSNSNPRVQKAIDAAKNYVKNPSDYAIDALRAADYEADYAAVCAARATVYAAADAAADAARAADYTACAAEYAARAAEYAARAAAYAAEYAARAAACAAACAARVADYAETEKFQKDLLIEIFEAK